MVVVVVAARGRRAVLKGARAREVGALMATPFLRGAGGRRWSCWSEVDEWRMGE